MPNNIEESNNFFVPTKCLFCEQTEDRILYPAHLSEKSFTGYTYSARRKRKREHYRIVVCQNCALIRSDPVMQEEKLQELYAESQFIFAEEAPYAARTYAALLKKLMDTYHPHIASVLEIGCSTGFFLEEAAGLGIHDVIGIEPSTDCYQHANEPIKSKIINEVYKPELLTGKTFDVICSFHVFDHLRDPLTALISLTEHLKPGGYVMLVCHDVESWSTKLFDKYSPIFDIEHIYLFSRKTLTMLVERAGLTCLEIGSLVNTYPLGYWLRMLPGLGKWSGRLPAYIQRMPLTLKPGNLYIFGQKR